MNRERLIELGTKMEAEVRTYAALTGKSNEELIALAIDHVMPKIDDGTNVAAVQLMLEIFKRLNPKFGT